MTNPLLLCLLAATTALAADPARIAATSINALGIDLLRSAAKSNESTLLSPFSIQTALSMTYAGAEGETQEQMAKVLHYPEVNISDAFASLEQQLDAMSQKTEKLAAISRKRGGPSEPITLAIANRLFAQSGFEFRPAYFALLKNKYDAPLQQLDFRKNAEAATKMINTWVEKQTRERIRNLIPKPLLPDTRLVLVNAIYLKAPWADEFNENATSSVPFHAPAGKVSVPTMVQKETLSYAKQDGFTSVALPYIGGELQFLILLPDAVDGLATLEKKLTPDLLQKCASMENREIVLHLPKFKLQPPVFQLSDTLEKLGMKSAFDVPEGSANFNGIAPRKPDSYLKISDVFHKTFIEIDEKGTEAAAATAVVMAEAGARFDPTKPIEVRVDRPFLFAIQHRPTGACLFLGRMVQP